MFLRQLKSSIHTSKAKTVALFAGSPIRYSEHSNSVRTGRANVEDFLKTLHIVYLSEFQNGKVPLMDIMLRSFWTLSLNTVSYCKSVNFAQL